MVHRLIAGPGGVYICDECIDLCREIIAEEQLPQVRSDCVFCGERASENPFWSVDLWRWKSIDVTEKYVWYCHEDCLKRWKPARLGEGFGTLYRRGS
jgi:hypothetical protein